jgi:hypothetical protein
MMATTILVLGVKSHINHIDKGSSKIKMKMK